MNFTIYEPWKIAEFMVETKTKPTIAEYKFFVLQAIFNNPTSNYEFFYSPNLFRTS